MANFSAADSARERAVVKGTNAKFNLAWDCYKTYLKSIGIKTDWYLDYFSRDKKHKILGTFCHAFQEGGLQSKSVRPNKSEPVRATLGNVSQAFKLANRPDPKLDGDGKFAFILQRHL